MHFASALQWCHVRALQLSTGGMHCIGAWHWAAERKIAKYHQMFNIDTKHARLDLHPT